MRRDLNRCIGSVLDPWSGTSGPPVTLSSSPQSLSEFDSIPDGFTTIIVRNIPLKYTCELLLGVWPADGTYDYLYLPSSYDKNVPMGYAFVNFTSRQFMIDFVQRWNRQYLPGLSDNDESRSSCHHALWYQCYFFVFRFPFGEENCCSGDTGVALGSFRRRLCFLKEDPCENKERDGSSYFRSWRKPHVTVSFFFQESSR